MPLGPYAELEFDLAGALRDRLIEMAAYLRWITFVPHGPVVIE